MGGQAFNVLMVCTGNVCRSPQAESILISRIADLESSAELVGVASAGTHALVGQPMVDQAALRAIQHGGIRLDHSARQLTTEMVESANLIFAMSKEHRRSIAQLVPNSSRRTFMLTEFARVAMGCLVDARKGKLIRPGSGDWSAWTALAELRRGYYPVRRGDTDDVIDPYRHSDRTFDASADRINSAINELTSAIYFR